MNYRDALIACGVDAETVEKFLDWHKANPEVWKAFESVAMDVINTGSKKWGAKAVVEVARWKLRIERRQDYAVNNNFTAYYARIFALKYPQHADFFEFREVKGLGKEAA